MASNSREHLEDAADSAPGTGRTGPEGRHEQDREGGDPVCYAFMVCEECGAVVSEGHLAGCSLADQAATPLQIFAGPPDAADPRR